MAFKRTKEDTGAPDSIVFLNQYVEGLSKGLKKTFEFTIHFPTSIVAPKSGKGFILGVPNKFAAFIWNNSSDGKALRELIEAMKGFQPAVFIDYKEKSLFQFGFDDEVPIRIEQTKEERWAIFPEPKTNEAEKISLIKKV